MVLFILYVVLSCEPADENPIWCNHLNETSPAVLLHGTIWFVRQVVLSCEPVDEILFGCGVTMETKPLQQYFYTVLFGLSVMVLSCEPLDESYCVTIQMKPLSAVLSHGAIFFKMWL